MKPLVSITGGFGYLGGRLAVHLAASGYRVRLLARNARARRPSWAQNMECSELDLMNESDLAGQLKGSSAVVHLAALNARACAADPEAAERVNVKGTRVVASAACLSGVEKLIYMSTAHVYGAPLSGKLIEDSPTTNTHPYAATHRAAEEIVCQSLRPVGTVLRLSNGVGVPMDTTVDCGTLISNDLCRQAVSGSLLVLSGSGKDTRDFIAISDIVGGVRHFLEMRIEEARGLFNFASGNILRTIDLAELISQRTAFLCGKTPGIKLGEGTTGHFPTFEICRKKLKKTGFRFEGSLDNEIDATLNFYLKSLRNA